MSCEEPAEIFKFGVRYFMLMDYGKNVRPWTRRLNKPY